MSPFLGFPTKGACKAAVQIVLNKAIYRLGAPLTGEDLDLVHSVLKLHPEYAAKVGSGIKQIVVADPPSCYPNTVNSKGFWIERTDGSKEDISYLKCLRPKDPETVKAYHKQDLGKGFRGAVSGSISALKNQLMGTAADLVCPLCGNTVARCEVHADHYPVSFATILGDFKQWWLEIKEERLETVDRGSYLGIHYLDWKEEEMDPLEFEQEWVSFHNNYEVDEGIPVLPCGIRLICKTCNLKRSKKPQFCAHGIGANQC